MDIEKIRTAVRKHHGGMADASDTEILAVWNSLLPATQKLYLKTKGAKEDASRPKPK